MKVADVEPNFTAVAPVNEVPVITTLVPTIPLVGLKLLIPGVTLKTDALVPVPAGLVTDILPVVAPIGTVALIEVPDTILKVIAGVPLKLTAVVPPKFVPVSVTVAPIAPLVGVNDVMVGGLMTVND